MSPTPPDIADYLKAGWVVAGFSTSFSEALVVFYSVLLQRREALIAVTVGRNRSSEVFRAVEVLSPTAAQDVPVLQPGSRPAAVS